MAERTPLDRGIAIEGEKTRYRVMLESIHKFRHFFVAFVFAILSFSMQFPTKANTLWVKVPEFAAWILIAATGYFALKDCGGFAPKLTDEVVEGIKTPQRVWMWRLFFVAMILLLFARIFDGLLPFIDVGWARPTINNRLGNTMTEDDSSFCLIPGLGYCVRERCNFWDEAKEECTAACFESTDQESGAADSDGGSLITFYEDFD